MPEPAQCQAQSDETPIERNARWLAEARALVEKCCPKAHPADVEHAAERIFTQLITVWMRYA